MAFCKNCGKELKEDAMFCGGCGAARGTVTNQPVVTASASVGTSDVNSDDVEFDNIMAAAYRKRPMFLTFGNIFRILGKILLILGYLCCAFGALDYLSGIFGIFDMTGVSWSPILAVVIGIVFFTLSTFFSKISIFCFKHSGFCDEDDECDDDDYMFDSEPPNQ